MMMDSWIVALAEVPQFVVYVTALVLAISYRHRAPAASALTMVGAILLLLIMLAWASLRVWPELLIYAFDLLRAVSALLSAAGHAFLIAAIFVGRKNVAGRGFQVQPVVSESSP